MSAEKNKGMALINSVIAVSIFSVMFICILVFYGINISISRKQDFIAEGTYKLELFKNTVIANMEYDEVKNVFGNGIVYIRGNDMKKVLTSESELSDIVLNLQPDGDYLEIKATVEHEAEAFKLNAVYFYDGGSLNCIFYKGNYV